MTASEKGLRSHPDRGCPPGVAGKGIVRPDGRGMGRPANPFLPFHDVLRDPPRLKDFHRYKKASSGFSVLTSTHIFQYSSPPQACDSITEVQMKIGRFEYQGNIRYGLVAGEEVRFLKGGLFSAFQESWESVLLSHLKVLVPVLPSKIVCVGQNYREHIQELGVPVPGKLVIFLKPPSCLVGPGQATLFHPEPRAWTTKASWPSS